MHLERSIGCAWNFMGEGSAGWTWMIFSDVYMHVR